MPRQLREFPAYLRVWDWDRLFDGRAWLVAREEYAPVKDRSFQVYAWRAAAVRRITIRTRRTEEGLAIQRVS
jgi:hypothetical protein